MDTKSAAEIARRFVKHAPGRIDNFEEGVKNPRRDWMAETAAAEDNYEKGVEAGIKRKAFGKGVKKAGTAKQQAKTLLNLKRWAEGIENAEETMRLAMESVVRVLEATKLPPRYSKGDPRNYERSKVVGTALRKAKEEGRL